VIDDLDGDAESSIEARRAAQLLVDGVPIDEQKEVIALVAFEEDTARADVDREERVEGDGAEAQKIDGLGERMDPVHAHVLRREDRRRGGSRGGGLDRLGSRGDDVLVEQTLEIRSVLGSCRERRGRKRHTDDLREESSAAPGHSNTRTSFSTSARSSTCWRRARVR
jgi:hypothetical protein